MTLLHTLAGIAWDPEIRGILTVLTGVVVLCGSIWLIISTNTGWRLGTLISLAGLFGWMMVMGAVWWIYGIGWRGPDPSWTIKDINYGDLEQSAVESVRTLPNPGDLPNAFELVVEQGSPEAQAEFIKEVPEEDLAGLEPDAAERLQISQQIRNEQLSLGAVLAFEPELLADTDFQGWRLLTPAQSGEPQAAAQEALVEYGIFGAEDPFLFIDAYTKGGKPRLPADPNRWDRIRHWITNSARVVHPPRYAVVQFRSAHVAFEAVPGEAPPALEFDEEAPVISVVMLRDLGHRRLNSALVTIGSAIIFAVLCYMLHVRDQEVSRRRTAWAAGKGKK
ncbi:MAG: hypothetical protein MUE34_08865 [Acidimicrobiales bacterium]|jgi:hypothetical protein|nr:hypothetical protein [Acidimicrobiales bacterium]